MIPVPGTWRRGLCEEGEADDSKILGGDEDHHDCKWADHVGTIGLDVQND